MMNRLFLESILVFVLGVVFLVSINQFYHGGYPGKPYVGISSDALVQTLPAELLRAKPFESLYFNHIQPPMFDGIRAFIASFWALTDGPLPEFVDKGIYRLYVIVFGILSILIFLWIRISTESFLYSWMGALLWIIHPGPIAMAAFLDGTLISSLFVSWMVFEIWLIGKEKGSVSRVVIAASLSFLTRAHFQWFFAPVLLLALIFVGVDRKRLLIGMGVFLLVVGLYCTKQFILFGSVYSFGWMGTQLAGSMWIEEVGERTAKEYKESCGGETIRNKVECKQYLSEKFPSELVELDVTYPNRAKVVSGGSNTEDTWWINHVKSRIARKECLSEIDTCIKSFWRSFQQNYPEYWVESWDRRHPVVDDETGIPWTGVYYRISHNYSLLIMGGIVVLLTVFIGRRENIQKMPIIGVSLVPIYVFVITLLGNNYDAFEGGRLKFLLEPTIYVFIVVQVFLLVKYIYLGSRSEAGVPEMVGSRRRDGD